MSADWPSRRVMSISHAEFRHSLKPLGKFYPYRSDATGRKFTLHNGGGEIEIRLGEQGCKRIGALELPETVVEFSFHACTAEAIEHFLSRFELAFRRGGG
jgi:hypothetical protein